MPQLVLCLWLTLLTTLPTEASQTPPFRFDITDEPSSLDPALSETGVMGYVLNAIYEGLYRYEDGKAPLAEGAQFCQWKTPKTLVCALRKGKRWSDGSPVTAADYVYGINHLKDPASRSRSAENFQNVHVRALNPNSLEFQLVEEDSEFLLRLTHESVSPIKDQTDFKTFAPDKAHLIPCNGPYRIKSWVKGKKIILEPNPHYGGSENRPNLEAIIIPDENAAHRLYLTGELQFLRKIPAAFVEEYKTRKDFLDLPAIRFDYIGFSLTQKPFTDVDVRKAFAQGLDYSQSGKIFKYEAGNFGCAGLPAFLVGTKHCLKKEKPTLSDDIRALLKAKPPLFLFSQQGGEFNKITGEWLQNQWKQSLAVEIQPQGREVKVFMSSLRTSPPPLFLKRVAVDRPTCLAALENFGSQNPNNFIHYQSPQFDSILRDLRQTPLYSAKQKDLCEKGLELLIQKDFALIPTGRWSLTMLIDPHFRGWKFNQLNQLDLRNLHWEEK